MIKNSTQINKIIVKKDSIESAFSVHKSIPEFDEIVEISDFEERYQDKKHIIFVAYLQEKPIGYLIAYDKFKDGSIYCWMAGVIPEFRKKGVLTKIMQKLELWCMNNKIQTIHIKTRNSRREMLAFLVKNEFLLAEVLPENNIQEHRIMFQKKISFKS